MFKALLLAVVAAASFVGTANAYTYTIDLTTMSASKSDVSYTGIIDPSAAALEGNAHVVPAGYSSSGLTASPTGSMYMSSYIYVTGNAGSKATFALNNASGFGLTWGTVDTYNTLTVKTMAGDYVVTGAALMAALSGLGFDYHFNGNNAVDSTGKSTQVDVIFKAPAIYAAVLTSSQNSFEAGNFSAVPLPGALALFGAGIAGLAGFAARRREMI